METLTQAELFERFVGNIADHASVLTLQSGKIRMSAVHGMDTVEYFVEQKGEFPDVWDRCYYVVDGHHSPLGNRCGLRSHYAAICAKALHTFITS